jgi:hypothetical protein
MAHITEEAIEVQLRSNNMSSDDGMCLSHRNLSSCLLPQRTSVGRRNEKNMSLAVEGGHLYSDDPRKGRLNKRIGIRVPHETMK